MVEKRLKSSVIKHQNQVSKSSVKIKHQNQASKSSITKSLKHCFAPILNKAYHIMHNNFSYKSLCFIRCWIAEESIQ